MFYFKAFHLIIQLQSDSSAQIDKQFDSEPFDAAVPAGAVQEPGRGAGREKRGLWEHPASSWLGKSCVRAQRRGGFIDLRCRSFARLPCVRTGLASQSTHSGCVVPNSSSSRRGWLRAEKRLKMPLVVLRVKRRCLLASAPRARRSPVRREERFPGSDIAGCRAAGAPRGGARRAGDVPAAWGPAGRCSCRRRLPSRPAAPGAVSPRGARRPPGGAAALAARGGRTCRVRGRRRAGSAVPRRSAQSSAARPRRPRAALHRGAAPASRGVGRGAPAWRRSREVSARGAELSAFLEGKKSWGPRPPRDGLDWDGIEGRSPARHSPVRVPERCGPPRRFSRNAKFRVGAVIRTQLHKVTARLRAAPTASAPEVGSVPRGEPSRSGSGGSVLFPAPSRALEKPAGCGRAAGLAGAAGRAGGRGPCCCESPFLLARLRRSLQSSPSLARYLGARGRFVPNCSAIGASAAERRVCAGSARR